MSKQSVFSRQALERSRTDALEWIEGNGEGFPRSWEQEEANARKRDYELYEPDWCAPPIAGYEQLEREGVVIRKETVVASGQERVRFLVKQRIASTVDKPEPR